MPDQDNGSCDRFSTIPEEDTPVEASIAATVIPYRRDTERAKYLSYMATGFSTKEALHLVKRSGPWLSWCRSDPQFAALEENIPNIRRTVAKEYLEIEFHRNLRLVFQLDFEVLWETLHPKSEAVYDTDSDTYNKVVIPMSKTRQDWLLRLRSQYTPQQMQILDALVSGKGDGWNFSAWTANNPDAIQLERTEKVTMVKGSGS